MLQTGTTNLWLTTEAKKYEKKKTLCYNIYTRNYFSDVVNLKLFIGSLCIP